MKCSNNNWFAPEFDRFLFAYKYHHFGILLLKKFFQNIKNLKTVIYDALLVQFPLLFFILGKKNSSVLKNNIFVSINYDKHMSGGESLNKIVKPLKMLNKDTVEIELLDHVTLDINEVGEIYKKLDELSKDRHLKKLLILKDTTQITIAARNLMVTENEKRKDRIIGEAFVVHTIAQKIIINFYMMYLRNIYPVQFFTDKKEAEAWLLSIGNKP